MLCAHFYTPVACNNENEQAIKLDFVSVAITRQDYLLPILLRILPFVWIYTDLYVLRIRDWTGRFVFQTLPDDNDGPACGERPAIFC